MATVVLDAGGVIYVYFLEPGTTIIADRYIAYNFETTINKDSREEGEGFAAVGQY